MNISTGGPHILLFERDQQLAALLTSELQLAGYANHVARTAVEVFDAIARHPVRLVLVDLAQAAAARREFWVALDSQRRDRKVQVLTFHCYNLASYGSRDLEDHTQNAIADLEVDGMLGLMNLVDAVRSRIPLVAPETSSHTLPRLSKITSPMATASPTIPSQRPTGFAQSQASPAENSAFLHPINPVDSGTFTAAPRSDASQGQHPPMQQTTQASQPLPAYTPQTHPQSPQTGLSGSNQPSYSEKIRAVLYPTQRGWSSHNPESQSPIQEITPPPNTGPFHASTSTPPAQPATESTVLQQLASGQLGAGHTSGESGLAQLSRMVQGFHTPVTEEPFRHAPVRQEFPAQVDTIPQTPPAQSPLTRQAQQKNPWAIPAGTSYSSLETEESLKNQTPLTHIIPQTDYQASDNRSTQAAHYSTMPSSMKRTAQTEEPISVQPLRASPIQDMPIERTVTSSVITDTNKRAEAHLRSSLIQPQTTNQTQQGAMTQAASPLASIVSPMPTVTQPQNRTSITTSPYEEIQTTTEERQEHRRAPEPEHTVRVQRPEPEQQIRIQAPLPEQRIQRPEPEPQVRIQESQERPHISKPEQQSGPLNVANERRNQGNTNVPQENIEQKTGDLAEDINEFMANNPVLLDIVQSFPPMPAITQTQDIQPQVLNGRATRALNKVLLDGHLVPQDRLEVAQNIQRMLRGVDLNYQLGDILLMFKLLTPDQLLAASLVSYGLINTTQISALGRIRQELHAMGLEYDLENLLILFRILTPEQLREVRSIMQS